MTATNIYPKAKATLITILNLYLYFYFKISLIKFKEIVVKGTQPTPVINRPIEHSHN